MLRKVIAAAMSAALLANAGMILSANDSYAENSATTETEVASTSAAAETEVASTSVETTVVSEVSTDETTTNMTDTTSLEDVGAAIRETLDIKVRDIVIFDDVAQLYDAEGNTLYIDCGWSVWIIGVDDANQRFRVQSPELTPNGEQATYLLYSDAPKAVIVSHEGHVVGDIDYSGSVNAIDFTLMKRYMIKGWKNDTKRILADWNADAKVDMKDLVMMQHWLLGIIK